MADRSKLGYEFPVRVIDVEKGKIAEFVMAVAQKDTPDEIKSAAILWPEMLWTTPNLWDFLLPLCRNF